MDRLYLIRVDMERFLGPLTLKEVKEAYLRMEFGMQDEIAGSLRPWVTFDDLEAIKRHYPEMVQLVQREMLSGWGVSAHSASLPHTRSKKLQAQEAPQLVSRTLLLTILTALIVLAILLLKDGQGQELLLYFKDRTFFTAKSLYAETYNARFESFMDRNREAINQAMRKKKGYQQWLPLVRAVAFERDGRWDGLSAKRLRGKADEDFPVDCSMAAWEQRWAASREAWERFLDGRELPSAEWTQILTVDPHWIRLRSPAAGWIKPGSYPEACLRMALKALQRNNSGQAPEVQKVIEARLGWQLGMIASTDRNDNFEMSGTLWALSCLEDTREREQLNNCLGSATLRPDWRAWLDAVLVQRRLVIASQDARDLVGDELAQFERDLSNWEAFRKTLRFDYDAETAFYREILLQKGQVGSALQTMQQRYPQLHWTY